jgi:phosphoribosylaminoimidazole (AIR) synthetase
MTREGNLKWYRENVIKVDSEGAELLAEICEPTLDNSGWVDVLKAGRHGLAVLRIPEDYLCVVHSASGRQTLSNPDWYAESMVGNLVRQAEFIDAQPVAFSNVVDSSVGDRDLIERIGKAMVKKADFHNLAILNGENAVYGPMINCDANISGTMISVVSKDSGKFFGTDFSDPVGFKLNGTSYIVFDPKGQAVYMNSDGTGTKTDFYAMLFEAASEEWFDVNEISWLRDSIAMKLDDTIKIGARAIVVQDVVDVKGNLPTELMKREAEMIGSELGIVYSLQLRRNDRRIMGYKKGAPAYTVSGSAVSVIDEERLSNPLKPSAGEYLIVMTGIPNPRSNGITAKRKLAIELFGENYHLDPRCEEHLKYLATPSTILYPIFKRLVDEGLATSVYHMSGGAYKGKLAKPLAEHGLFVSIDKLFEPHPTEVKLMEASGSSTEDAYATWPMGNDGFVTTEHPRKTVEMIQHEFGLEAKVASKDTIKPARGGSTGVELTAFNGETVYFSGQKKAA